MSGPIGRKNLGGGYLDAADLPPASPLAGDEQLFGLQGGIPKSITPEQLNGSAIIQAMCYERLISQSFTALDKTPPLFTGTDQGLFGAEPVVCHLGNGGTVTQPAVLSWPFRRGLSQLSMSTASNSYAGISTTNYPFYPAPTGVDFYFGAVVGLTALPTGANQTFIVGITPPPLNGVPADGFYFIATPSNVNWIATLNGVSQSDTDTLFPVTTVNAFSAPAQWTTFEIMSNSDEDTVNYYINNTLVASPHKTVGNFYPTAVAMNAGAYCCQRGSTTANTMLVDAMHTKMKVIDASGYGFSTGLL